MKVKRLLTLILILALIGSLFTVSVFAAPVDSNSEDVEYDDSYGDEYEDEYEPPFTPEGGKAILIVLAVIFGIVIPLVPLCFYLVRLVAGKRKLEPVDFIIIGISSAWIIVGIALLVIVM